EVAQPEYWVKHVLAPVRFAQGISALGKAGVSAFVEFGPKPTLTVLAQACLPQVEAAWLPSLPKEAGQDEWATALGSLGALYVRGAQVDWKGFDAPYSRRRVALPTYPFQRERHWIEARAGRRAAGPQLHPLLGARLPWAGDGKVTAFEGRLAVDDLPFLKDHRIFGRVVVPGTALLEMARAAAEVVFGEGEHALLEVVLQQALVLPDEGGRTVQLHVSAEDEEGAGFKIFSQEEGAGEKEFTLHASGRIERNGAERESRPAEPLETLRGRCAQAVEVEAHYESSSATGAVYGPAFQGVAEL